MPNIIYLYNQVEHLVAYIYLKYDVILVPKHVKLRKNILWDKTEFDWQVTLILNDK